MLSALCGSRAVCEILLFIYVNRKAYGSQLQRALSVSLTPIQKGLDRLEKGGILDSYYEGKTRIYKLHAQYPLKHELEMLLKKAYTELPSHQKRAYYDDARLSHKEVAYAKDTLKRFWEALKTMKKLRFEAKTIQDGASPLMQGKGIGDVSIVTVDDNVVLFEERGEWQGFSQATKFSNVFKWTLDKLSGLITLEHLRYGKDNPVLLFHLKPVSSFYLRSIDAQFCESQTRFGYAEFSQNAIRLEWRVVGYERDEEVQYSYQA